MLAMLVEVVVQVIDDDAIDEGMVDMILIGVLDFQLLHIEVEVVDDEHVDDELDIMVC